MAKTNGFPDHIPSEQNLHESSDYQKATHLPCASEQKLAVVARPAERHPGSRHCPLLGDKDCATRAQVRPQNGCLKPFSMYFGFFLQILRVYSEPHTYGKR